MVKNPPADAGDTGDAGSIPGLGRSPGGGNGTHLGYHIGTIPILGNGTNILAWSLTGYSLGGSQRAGHD